MKIRLIIVMLIMCLQACQGPDEPQPVTGGKGGKTVLRITPEFQEFLIDTCTVYIKYATHDAPANGLYDDSAVCVLADTVPVATFSGLTKGIYYLYGVGYHSIGGHLPNVKGSKICTVNNEDTLKLYLPVYPYSP